MDEHSLHSPFFFDLYTTQIKRPVDANRFINIENLRQKLLRDHRKIRVEDLGSGANTNRQRIVSHIARTSMSDPRFSAIYLRIARHFQARTLVELGTSFGINTLYLAEAANATVTTFEGSADIADIAALTFEFAAKNNIHLIEGDIDKTLPGFLQTIRRVDFAFFDANHRYEATMRYFEWMSKKIHEKTVFIFDDIHHSKEMEQAWNALKAHRLVYGTADLFRCGIVFFDPSLNKQHVILQV